MAKKQPVGLTERTSLFAKYAFAEALRLVGVSVDPSNVVVTKEKGSYACSCDDPTHAVSPYAKGLFFGTESKGKVQLLSFVDPKTKFVCVPTDSWFPIEGVILRLR